MEPFKDKRPSIKRKVPPVIKQTKTSAYRILKANPLMLNDEETIKKMGLDDSKRIPKSVDALGISKCGNTNIVPKSILTKTSTEHKTKMKCVNMGLLNNKKTVKLTINDIKPDKCDTKALKRNGTTETMLKRTTSVKYPERQSISSMYKQKIARSKRRSKSAERFDPSKCFHGSILDKPALHDKSQSMDDVRKDLALDNVSPIRERQEEKIIFKTPIAYNRRSIASCTPTSNRPFLRHSSTPTPMDLQKRLNDWLITRGKSVGAFHHLKCFGIDKSNLEAPDESAQKEENKENIEAENKCKNVASVEVLLNNKELKLDTSNVIAHKYDVIAKDALDDLHKLIEDGYPSEQCEAWLGRIRQKHHELEEEPLFWECRAALEQCRGNISSAVEHYRKAIVKGAEVSTIEESLDHLLQKFSLLNINPDIRSEDTKNNRIILDARQAFKSTIIQFAVQERTLKKEGENKRKIFTTVTPVRRSTRLSTVHSNTPGIKLCDSLKEVNLNETTFHSNKYL